MIAILRSATVASVALFVTGATHAVPVIIESTGFIDRASYTGDTNFLPGQLERFQEATVRITFESNPSDLQFVSNTNFTASNAITSLQVEFNGDAYEFVGENSELNLVSTTSSGIDLDIQNEVNAFGFGNSADLSLRLLTDDTSESIGNLPLDLSGITFGLFTIQQDGETGSFGIEFNSVDTRVVSVGAPPVAVPTPAAFGAVGLLIPLMLRRKRAA